MRGMAQSSDSDIHSDFQPQIKATPSASVTEQIQQDIKDNKVFVYMKVVTSMYFYLGYLRYVGGVKSGIIMLPVGEPRGTHVWIQQYGLQDSGCIRYASLLRYL